MNNSDFLMTMFADYDQIAAQARPRGIMEDAPGMPLDGSRPDLPQQFPGLPYLPQLGQPYMESRDPTVRERINMALAGGASAGSTHQRYADKLAGTSGELSPIDLVPGPGDVMAFNEAQTPVDYGLATVGLIPAAGKPLKAIAKGVKEAVPAARGLLGLFPTATAEQIAKATREGGGYSVNLATGEVPDAGLMVGKYANADPKNMVLDEAIKTGDIENFVARNEGALRNPEHFLGTWTNPETAKTYLDVSKKFDEKLIRPATKFGEKTAQISGYNIGKGETFPVGNWKEFVASPEMQGRMSEMHAFGEEYLKKFGGNEWWDKAGGTSLDRIYGPAKSRQVGGFLAATAPNTNLRANTQAMSEYMRRNIKGEDIIQPNWRAGDQPGGIDAQLGGLTSGMMPMETGRANNLRLAQSGLLGDMRSYKVRDEALASTGDRTAAPLDRMWVHASEDPARGIFQGVEKGVMVKDTKSFSPYLHLREAAVVPGAAAAGEDVAPWSAKVWTGIRETIKQTSQLFGTPHRGGSIRGDSKGYSDHFDDLIKEKADKLGIAVKEMERRLMSGDANLLSYVLAAPVGYGILGMLPDKGQSPDKPS